MGKLAESLYARFLSRPLKNYAVFCQDLFLPQNLFKVTRNDQKPSFYKDEPQSKATQPGFSLTFCPSHLIVLIWAF
jgi:hypothetical protein